MCIEKSPSDQKKRKRYNFQVFKSSRFCIFLYCYLIADLYGGESMVINSKILSEDIIMIKKSHIDKKCHKDPKSAKRFIMWCMMITVRVLNYNI